MFSLIRKNSPKNIKNDTLSGLTVALALVPEAVAFAMVAHVNPLVGLYAAFIMGLITAILGGRPGLISGATGAIAAQSAQELNDSNTKVIRVVTHLLPNGNCEHFEDGKLVKVHKAH